MRILNCAICFLIIAIGPCIQMTITGIVNDANKDELIFAHVVRIHFFFRDEIKFYVCFHVQ